MSIGSDRIATPGLSLLTRRSPILISPVEASTLVRKRPVVATRTLDFDASPRASPGLSEITPATAVEYADVDATTWFEALGSMTTTVPYGSWSNSVDGTHSATS